MKLHRIEVQNLNSLYGDHVVDLDDALAGASLFLIHGATGAGKSTLMDAVSLALFGETPRLDASRGDADADPRNVMSHDAGQCHAQVDFSKLERDGVRRRYRARWACRRAHRQADGRLQDAERSLERLEADGSWTLLTSSPKRKEYEPVFVEALEGFTVHDFKRSMLLAQGQFDALLDAPPEARASILERLTDTSDYKRWGQRAARVRAAYDRRLGELEARVDHHRAADPAQLEALRQKRAQSAEAVEAAEARSERLRVAREALRRLEESEAELARQRQRRRDVAASEPAAVLAATRAVEGRAAAQARLDAAEAAFERIRPLAEAALHATQALDHATTAAAERDEAVQRAATAHALADEHRCTARVALDEARAELSAATTRRDARPARRALVEAWDEIVLELDRLGRDAAALGDEDGQHEARTAALALARDEHRAAATHIERARERELAPLAMRVVAAREAVDAERGDDEAREHLEALRRAAQRTAAHLEGHRRHGERVDALIQALDEAANIEARAGELTAARARASARRDATQAKHEKVRARVEALRGGHERLLKVVSLATHRAGLAPGEPCPLCGSETHPFIDGHASEPTAELDASAAEVATAEADLTAARGENDAAAAKLSELAGRVAAVEDERAEVGARVERLTERVRGSWTELRESPGWVPLPDLDGSDAVEALRRLTLEAGERADQARATAVADERRFEDAVDALARATQAHDLEARRLEQAAASSAEREAALVARSEQLEAERAQLGERRRRLGERAAQLGARLQSFEIDVDRESAPSAASLASWSERTVAALETQRRLDADAEVARKAADEAAARARQADHDLDGLGRHLVERKREAARAQELLTTAQRTARERDDALLRAHAVDAADLSPREADGDTTNPTARWILEVRRVGAEAARCDLAEAQLAEHRAQAALVELRARLTELEQTAEATAQRCAAVRSHAEATATAAELAPDLETLESAATRAQAELEELRTRDRELHARWRMLEAQVANNETAVRELAEARKEAEPWLALHQLIGRRDGDAFKTFAQALNLARLIGRANVHLGRLSDRYRLAQAREGGAPTLEFVVEDLYHLCRARSPRSLSGGERFLVSLALALGLSDLRTVTMPIDTLLLDEGFGTLDPETLSTALGALQQLRASGRQVGIISHVVGLREQIDAQIVVEKVGDGRSRVRVALADTPLATASTDEHDDTDARAAG